MQFVSHAAVDVEVANVREVQRKRKETSEGRKGTVIVSERLRKETNKINQSGRGAQMVMHERRQ